MKLVNSKQMHQIDSLAVEVYGIPSIILMEHAATGAFQYIKNEVEINKSVLIVCGSGNNGGDGFALARLFHIDGYHVKINFLGNKEKLTADAKVNYDICEKLGVCFTDTIKGDVIVDCIFGTGLKRTVEGKYAEAIESINHSNAYVYAIDIASGLSSDTGEVLGVAVKADKTLTFQLGKYGLYEKQGIDYSGEVVLIDIFIPRDLLK